MPGSQDTFSIQFSAADTGTYYGKAVVATNIGELPFLELDLKGCSWDSISIINETKYQELMIMQGSDIIESQTGKFDFGSISVETLKSTLFTVEKHGDK